MHKGFGDHTDLENVAVRFLVATLYMLVSELICNFQSQRLESCASLPLNWNESRWLRRAE